MNYEKVPRAVVLLSGGLDSATTLALAQEEGFECVCLTVVYGQRHEAELEAARRVARQAGVKDHRFVTVSLREIGGSALTDDIEVPKDREDDGQIPVTYVPARNTVFLSLALGLAEVVGAAAVFIGVNAIDYSGYPDCRPEFVRAFEALAQVATKSGSEGQPLEIRAPLIEMTKAGVIEAGTRLGVDFGLTLSCYDPVEGRPCGHCDACAIRSRAFAELGRPDPGADRA